MTSKVERNNSAFDDIKLLIEQAKNQVAVTVNSVMSMLYWEIGNRINVEILDNQRAQYGKQVIVTLSKQLTEE